MQFSYFDGIICVMCESLMNVFLHSAHCTMLVYSMGLFIYFFIHSVTVSHPDPEKWYLFVPDLLVYSLGTGVFFHLVIQK